MLAEIFRLHSPQSDATVSVCHVPRGHSHRPVGAEFGGCRMKKLAGVAVMALAAALQPAAAADTDVLHGCPPDVYAPQSAVVIFTWTGFYFGVHGGGGWERGTRTVLLTASRSTSSSCHCPAAGGR